MDSPVTFDRLYEGARRFARLAMEAHAEEDQEVFLLHAGVSVERLAKAALARVHLTLLTEVNGKDDMLLHFAGALSTPPARLRTISASTAIARLRKMNVLPQKQKSGIEADNLDGLIELRNGVAHLGTDNVEDYLATFVTTVDKLLQHLEQDRGSFWESWSDTVRVIQDDQACRLQRDMRLRMDQARHRFRTRFSRLSEMVIDGAAKGGSERGLTVVEVSPGRALFRTLSQCPACDREAAFLFLGVDGNSLLFDLELKTESFTCELCGFRLSGPEEVEAAGLPAVLHYSVEDLTRSLTEIPNPAEGKATIKLSLPTVRPDSHDSL